MDERNISKAKSILSFVWNKFLDYGYFDFSLGGLASEDSIIRFSFMLKLKVIHMVLIILFFADEFQPIKRMSIHGGFKVVFGLLVYLGFRKLLKMPKTGIPIVLLSSFLFAVIPVSFFEIDDFAWGVFVYLCSYVFFTSLHLSMYVHIANRRNYGRNVKSSSQSIRFSEEEFTAICNRGMPVSEILEKANSQLSMGEYDVVLSRCRQVMEKSLRVFYYKKKREFPSDLNEAVNGLTNIGNFSEEEISSLHQVRMKANQAVHVSNQIISGRDAKFAIEQVETLYKKIKSEVGQVIF